MVLDMVSKKSHPGDVLMRSIISEFGEKKMEKNLHYTGIKLRRL